MARAGVSIGLASIEIDTPPDPERAFKAHTTYIIGRWKGGQVFSFKKVSAGDTKATLKACSDIARQYDDILSSVENVQGAGI